MEKVPFSLEDRLQEFSGRYSKGDDWSDYCVSSKGGKLLTGQNPASAASLGKKVKQAVFGSQDVGRKGAPVP